MKSFVLLFSHIILVLSASIAHAFTPAPLWSKGMGGTGFDTGYGVAVDGLGNVYVTGTFQATVNFGGSNLTSAGAGDIFLAKYDASGVHEWSQRFGSTLSDNGNAVEVDASGNVYVTGSFSGTVSFGGVGLVSAGGSDVFLAKYNLNGVHQWSVRFGSTNEDVGQDVGFDASGNPFLIGTFTGTVNFGGGGLISAGGLDIFLAKYNSSNAHQWSVRFGSTLGDYGQSLAIDGAGNVFATGSFNGTVNFGGGNLISAGQGDVFVIKYNNAGVHQWSQRFGGLSNDFGTWIGADGAGNVFATGLFLGIANFGGSNLTSSGGYDVYLAKYSAAGAHQWSHRYGGGTNDWGEALAVDASGDVYTHGYYQGTVDFGGGDLTSNGGSDVFLAKYDTNGDHQWSQHYGGTDDELGAAMALGPSGIFITGYFNGSASFGGTKLSSAGGSDAFVAKYSRGIAEPIITSIADVGNDQGGKAQILFSASGGDDASASNPVTHYVALRRDDPPPAAAPASAAPNDPSLLAGWIEVGSVDAFTDDAYGIVVPTVGDSTIANGQYYSVFMIRAATGLPGVFYASPIDSGYSLDNLAPGAPTNLVLAGTQLYWTGSPAADFDYFTAYGGFSSNFATAHVIGYTVASTQSVLGSTYPYYFVTATDFSGNESLPASVGGQATGVDDGPRSYVLSVTNFPNPFNPRTNVRYTVPSRGAVTVTIYDVQGAAITTLFNGVRDAGVYSAEWDGRAQGTPVGSGVYFVRIEHNGAARTKKMVMLK